MTQLITYDPPARSLSLAVFIVWLFVLIFGAFLGFFPYVMGAAPLAVIGFVRWFTRESPMTLEMTADGLELNGSQRIQNTQLRTVREFGRRTTEGQFHIHVAHNEGQLVIPAAIDFRSEELRDLLRSRLTTGIQVHVHEALETHLAEQLKLFGHDKVFCYGPREQLDLLPSGRLARKIAAILLLTSLLWGLSLFYSEYWMAPAIITAVIGGIVYLASFAKHNPTQRLAPNWKESTLVVAPTGIALIQGTLKGKLRWDEVQSLTLVEPAKFSASSMVPGLLIKIAGGQILVLDIYNESLYEIHRVMTQYLGRP